MPERSAARLTRPSFEIGASALARWFASPSTLLTGGLVDFRAGAGSLMRARRSAIGGTPSGSSI